MSGEVITINVGGTLFVTSVATLTQYPNSMLAAMFDPKSERPPARKDGQGNFFIDGEPEPFKVILHFLRRGKLSGDLGGCTLEKLEWEADYFGLEELLKIIGERKKAEEERKEKEGQKMNPYEGVEFFVNKTVEMRKKLYNAMDKVMECGDECYKKDNPANCCFTCSHLRSTCGMYDNLASKYEKKAAELDAKAEVDE